MSTRTVCDWVVDDKKGTLCEQGANTQVNLIHEGTPFAADLCNEHAKRLVSFARKSAPSISGARPKGRATGVPHSVVRLWAVEHPELVESVMGGAYQVPPKGRIPDKLIDAWRSASA